METRTEEEHQERDERKQEFSGASAVNVDIPMSMFSTVNILFRFI